MQINRELNVKWNLGIHIRTATKIVQQARQFSSDIVLAKDSTICDAKSVIQLLTLDAPFGDTLTIKATGKDAAEAVNTLTDFFENYRDEGDEQTSLDTY